MSEPGGGSESGSIEEKSCYDLNARWMMHTLARVSPLNPRGRPTGVDAIVRMRAEVGAQTIFQPALFSRPLEEPQVLVLNDGGR